MIIASMRPPSLVGTQRADAWESKQSFNGIKAFAFTRAKLDEYRARAASGAEKLRLMEAVFAWARDVGQGLDELTPEQRKQILQMVGEEVIVDRDDNVDITLAIPIESEPTTEDSVTVTSLTPSF